MSLKVVQTPRDRLQRLVDYAVRARRYWWIVAIFVVVGGALSVVFALTRPQVYLSSASLFYQERIQTSLLQGRDAATMQRNIGERYRELLLARSQLAMIIEDPELNPFPDIVEADGAEAAVEELRLAISFEVRGANTFRITYRDSNRHRAQKVAARLTELLVAKERDLRLEQAEATVDFAQKQLTEATDDLIGRERKRAEFLVKHPEFAQDEVQGQSEGAAVRRKDDKDGKDGKAASGSSNPRLSALSRQRDRIKARLAAPDGAVVPVRISRTPTAEERDAQGKVERAEDEVRQAQRQVEALRSNGLTDNHPDMKKAKDGVAQAQSRLKKAEVELAAAAKRAPPDEVVAPANPVDRAALEKELREVEGQISSERARSSGAPKPQPQVEKNDIADMVVALETEWARLRRELNEQSERVQSLNDSVFRAQLDAQTRIAEQGTALQTIDPANLPLKPIGKGKKLLVLAGLVVFTALGLALAVGLAIIDDRLYRRVDLEQLDIAPVLAVIPKAPRRGRREKS